MGTLRGEGLGSIRRLGMMVAGTWRGAFFAVSRRSWEAGPAGFGLASVNDFSGSGAWGWTPLPGT